MKKKSLKGNIFAVVLLMAVVVLYLVIEGRHMVEASPQNIF